MKSNIFQRMFKVFAVGVRIDHDAIATFASQQVVDRGIQRLSLDVPEGHVHCADGGHSYRPTTPVGPAIEILPDIFGIKWPAPNNARNHMVGEITRYR